MLHVGFFDEGVSGPVDVCEIDEDGGGVDVPELLTFLRQSYRRQIEQHTGVGFLGHIVGLWDSSRFAVADLRGEPVTVDEVSMVRAFAGCEGVECQCY